MYVCVCVCVCVGCLHNVHHLCAHAHSIHVSHTHMNTHTHTYSGTTHTHTHTHTHMNTHTHHMLTNHTCPPHMYTRLCVFFARRNVNPLLPPLPPQCIAMLKTWPKLTPESAMELLDYQYPDTDVRKWAVECLKALT